MTIRLCESIVHWRFLLRSLRLSLCYYKYIIWWWVSDFCELCSHFYISDVNIITCAFPCRRRQTASGSTDPGPPSGLLYHRGTNYQRILNNRHLVIYMNRLPGQKFPPSFISSISCPTRNGKLASLRKSEATPLQSCTRYTPQVG